MEDHTGRAVVLHWRYGNASRRQQISYLLALSDEFRVESYELRVLVPDGRGSGTLNF
jgi:hypothetical protein